jgi:glycerol-3-phosphate dehydrogenase
MKRNIDTLKNQLFDVLVIGGGIHGAATARECARRGLSTALIEKNDFGSATSANSLKIIHGGLRYLQHLNIKRMRESIISRRMMCELSPHNVRELSCLIPNSGYGLRSNMVMRIGLMLNDCIAFDRNKGIKKECRIPSGNILPLSQCKELFPAINWNGMTGGSVWHDAIALNSDRLTLAFVKEAVRNGASAANYLEMQELLVENGSIKGCRAFDTLSNEQVTINARTVVITGGAWNNSLLKTAQVSEGKQTLWAKAVNIIVCKPLFKKYAIGLTGEVDYRDQDAVLKKKGRFFFFVPWRGYTMIGTTYKRFDGPYGQIKADRQDIEEALSEVNAIYPAAQLTFEDVTNAHAGLLPMSSLHGDKNGDVQLEKETMVMEYGDGVKAPKGLLSVKSVKFTTAPVVAIETCAKVTRFLQRMEKTALSTEASSSSFISEKYNASPQFVFLEDRYGKESVNVLPYVMNNREKVSIDPPLCLGELDFFLQEEMALKVADVVFRRSELATAECPSDEVLRKISAYLGKQLGWDEQRVEAEIHEVKEHFIWN